ncbi:MAG: S8 family serine peptidase [Microbacterium sp.]
MQTRSRRRLTTAAAALAAAAVVAAAGIAGPAWAADEDVPATPAPHSKAGQQLDLQKLSPALTTATSGRHRVFVQLSGEGAADAAADASSTSAGKSAAKSRRSQIKKAAAAAFAAARGQDKKADTLYTTTNTVPGFAAELNDAAIEALAARSDVVKITPLIPKHLDNSSTAQLTKAVNNWQSDNIGKGVRVGIIDTGIDYTHADFGGEGTSDAYETALADSAGSWTPNAKVVGGWDFVGDDYDADPTSATYQPVPQPDANPIDCNSHGTHVAGTVAGYGVTADGASFAGDYSTLTAAALDAMSIGPGMAPGAELYALKVFGCEGSTDAVLPALDWALDPNGDGDFSDHLDIVNLSLGSDYGVVDDPENAVIDALAKHGVLPVIASGNAGDLTSVGGSPGNAVRALTVASTVDAMQLRDGLTVNAPADVAGTASGQFSVAYPWSTSAPVTGAVVAMPSADNADGCAAFSAAEAAAVAGKVVWLEWDDNDATRLCGSAARAANAADAGAIGALFTSSLNVFAAGITGSAVIPVFQFPKTETDRLRPALDAGTLNVTFDGSLQGAIKSVTASIADTLSSFSSRGVHGSIGVVKPDIAAPGDTITSAGMGTGNGQLTISGTSMATPNVAGTAALVKYAHPTWTAEQLKAGLMNTAGHDVYTGEDQTGSIYGPNRVGAGRIDSRAAVTNDLLVYSKDRRGGVSASFGVVDVPITSKRQTEVRTLVVQNTGTKRKTVSLSYEAITAQPGVRYSVSPSKVVLSAGKKTTVRVFLTVSPSALRKTLDPTMDDMSGIGVARDYVSDSSGRVLAKESGKAALRVPVYAAVRPVSQTWTTAIAKTKSGATTSSLRLSGKGFAQGTGSESFTSLVSVLQFGAASGKLKACAGAQIDGCLTMGSDRSGDLRYVGAGSTPVDGDYTDGWLHFGINTWGQWDVWGTTMIPFVDYDVSGDGVPDFETYMQPYPDTDVPLAITVDLDSGDVVDMEPVNFNWGDVDTNVFDNDTMVLPVWPAAIGVTSTTTSFPITYQVGTYSAYTGGITDLSPAIAYDVVDPAVSVSDPLYLDQGGTAIAYQLGADANKSSKALVLHLQGEPGDRAEVVAVSASTHKPKPYGKRQGSSSLKKWDEHWMFHSDGE